MAKGVPPWQGKGASWGKGPSQDQGKGASGGKGPSRDQGSSWTLGPNRGQRPWEVRGNQTGQKSVEKCNKRLKELEKLVQKLSRPSEQDQKSSGQDGWEEV